MENDWEFSFKPARRRRDKAQPIEPYEVTYRDGRVRVKRFSADGAEEYSEMLGVVSCKRVKP